MNTPLRQIVCFYEVLSVYVLRRRTGTSIACLHDGGLMPVRQYG
jgi:hypothetical protein